MAYLTYESALRVARVLTPHMSMTSLKNWDGELLVAHGTKLKRVMRGAAPSFRLTGYAQDGSDVQAALAHAKGDPCPLCRPALRAG